MIASAVAAFFYIRVIVLMFFQDPAADGPSVVVPSSFTTVAIGLTVAVTIVIGVLPQPILDLVGRAGIFIS